MASYSLSKRARADITEIARFTKQTWSGVQADLYLDELESAFETLCASPGIGRSAEQIRPGLRRMEHASHVIFYEVNRGGITIARILHKAQVPVLRDFG